MARSRHALRAVLEAFAARRDQATEDMVKAYQLGIPAYRDMSPAVLADVRRVSRSNLELLNVTLQQDRLASEQELAPLTAGARDRLHEGASLDDLLHAYRLGTGVAWAAIVEAAAAVEGGGEAALEIAGRVMRFVDQVSTAVAHAYLLEGESAAQDEEEKHRLLLDHLLAGDLDRACVLADGLDIVPPWPGHVAAVHSAGSPAPVGGVARLLRRSLSRHNAVVARRGGNILVLLPQSASMPAVLMDHLRGFPSAVVAWVPHGAGTFSQQVAEVQTVLSLSEGRTGSVRLEDVLTEAMVSQAGGRTQELLAACATAMQDSMGTDARPVETLLSFVIHNGSISAVGRDLHVHPNTVLYRLKRVRAATGLDPHSHADLFLLWASIRARGLGSGDQAGSG